MRYRILALLFILLVAAGVLPVWGSAEAGDWDPLTDPSQVRGTQVGSKTFATTLKVMPGKDAELLSMPILTSENTSYNATAYCGTKAVSSDTDILEVKSIQIGKYSGGVGMALMLSA